MKARHQSQHSNWTSTTGKNFVTGCKNNCLYCSQKARASRFHQVEPAEWGNCRVRPKDVNRVYKRTTNLVEAPSSHDIWPEILDHAITFYKNYLSPGNNIILVTKPNFLCIKRLCQELRPFKNQIMFRFTIGSSNNEVLSFWEPQAPPFEERLESLQLVNNEGYQTSVSCEPMLDNNIGLVVKAVSPYVSDKIWLGKINDLKARLKFNQHCTKEVHSKAAQLLTWQSDQAITALHQEFRHNPLIEWKTSIRKIVGIP